MNEDVNTSKNDIDDVVRQVKRRTTPTETEIKMLETHNGDQHVSSVSVTSGLDEPQPAVVKTLFERKSRNEENYIKNLTTKSDGGNPRPRNMPNAPSLI